MSFKGLSTEICEEAWRITCASVLFAANYGTTNKIAGTIVVCLPLFDQGGESNFIFVADVDMYHPNNEKYEQIAKAKAEVSLRTGLPSRKVQQDAPYLYQEGMTKWGGSVIENGLVVAFSGVQAVFDEAIAGTMLRWIVALCQNEMTKEGGVMGNGESFI